MAWWIWITMGIGLCIAEIVVPSFFILFFGLGAIIAGLLVSTGLLESLSLQLAIFTVTSVALLLLFRSSIMKMLARKDGSPEPDSLIGEWAVAKVTIEPSTTGKVELRGSSWDGRNSGAKTIAAAERCQVQSIDGLTLVVLGSSESTD